MNLKGEIVETFITTRYDIVVPSQTKTNVCIFLKAASEHMLWDPTVKFGGAEKIKKSRSFLASEFLINLF